MRAVACGELPSDVDIRALARFLTAGFQGLRLIGKVNPGRAALEDVARTMLQCLNPSAQTKRNRRRN
jgi:hypothetical protein